MFSDNRIKREVVLNAIKQEGDANSQAEMFSYNLAKKRG